MTFLFTVGAKALVMCERKNNDAEKIKQSIEEEQLAKQEMVMEADTRLLKREMSLPPGLPVIKLGKDNKSRTINIQFAVLHSRHVWNNLQIGVLAHHYRV